MIRAHYLQHVPFEGIGSMHPYFERNEIPVTCTRLFDGEALPHQDDFELLIVMGGPMGVYDTDEFPWLKREREFIRQSIHAGKKVLGICLGAQLIASALGAKAVRNKEKEIGWHPIQTIDSMNIHCLEGILRDGDEVFHWHGDTFGIPDEAISLYRSEACENQGFIIDDRILGLQFHLETTEQSAKDLITHCASDITPGPHVQDTEAMLKEPARFEKVNAQMDKVLESFIATP